jgi:hypothetical protein
MQVTGNITPDNLMTLEAYAKWRKAEKPNLVAHRRLRTVLLGDHMSLQFESERTIRYQIQEMLRIERIFEEEGILQEIEAYRHLVPDGTNWKATMMIEYPDVEERRLALSRLINVEDHVYVEIDGLPKVYAIADEDLDRENEQKTSAVHFLRFEFNAQARDAIKAGRAVTMGCDHENYGASQKVSSDTLASLVSDLR